MDESIRIPVDIDYSKGLADIGKFGSGVKKEIVKLAPGGKISIPLAIDSKGTSTLVNELKKQLSDVQKKGRLQITADGTGFTKTLGQLEAQLKSFERGLRDAGNVESFNRINRAIDVTKQKIEALRRTPDPFNKLKPGADQASFALTNLGRVVQDAPYGFLGIANNLNPLLESFQRLKAATGSSATAFKALLGSLTGVGGLGLAISLVSSGLVLFGDRLFSSKTNTEASEAALKKYKDTIDSVAESIDGLSKNIQFLTQLGAINLKITAGGSAIKGDVDLFSLRQQSILQRDLVFDLNESRRKLIEESDKANKDQNLNEKDRAKAAEDFAKKISDVDKSINEESNKQRLIYREIALQKLDDLADANKKALEEQEKFVSDTIALAKKISDATKDRITLKLDINFLDTKSEEFQKSLKFIQAFRAEKFKFIIPVDPVLDLDIPKIEGVADSFTGMFAQELKTATETTDFSLIDALIEEAKSNAQKRTERLALNLSVRINPNIDPSDFNKAIKESLIQLNSDFITMVGNFKIQLATAVGEGIADAISSGDLKGLFSGIFQVIGGAMVELGKTLIATAIGLEAIKKAFKTLNPGIALAAGVGLVALGTIIKTRVAGATPFAEGGLVSGPLLGLVGEGRRTSRNNPEVMAPLDKLKSFFGNSIQELLQGKSGGRIGNVSMPSMNIPDRVVLEAHGDSLVAVMSITERKQARGG